MIGREDELAGYRRVLEDQLAERREENAVELLDQERRDIERAEAAVRDLCESPEAVEAFWSGAFRGSAKSYAASQTWDGHDGRPIRLHAERVADGLVRTDTDGDAA